MKKSFFLLLSIVFIIISCGIEETLYFKEPSYLKVEYDSSNIPVLKFYGFNQEKDGTNYLFSGYDLYYYFDNEANRKKVVVFKPYNCYDTLDTNPNRNKNLIPATDIKGSRYIYSLINTNDFLSIYLKITIPVTNSMIQNILYEGNSNNVICYFNNQVFNDGDYSNPYENPGNKTITIDNLYPALDDYPPSVTDFKGFLDKRFYDYKNITPIEDNISYSKYKVYFYAVSKGLDGTILKSSLDNFIESSKSSVVEVIFLINK